MEHRAYTAMNDIDSFIDMFSCASGLPAWKLEGWLEIYFKLRVLQELEKGELQREHESSVEIVSAPAVPLPERSAPPPPPAPPDDDPPTEKKLSGNGARRKREILDRLHAARSEGISSAKLVEASAGKLNSAQIMNALQCMHLHISVWEEISIALEKLGY